MFKNKAFQVKMIDDTPTSVHAEEPKPRFSTEEIQLMKEAGRFTALYFGSKLVIDAALKLYLKN